MARLICQERVEKEAQVDRRMSRGRQKQGASAKPGVLVSAGTLRTFCVQVLEKLGVSHDDARITSDVLVAADLRGVDSHGVARLSRYGNYLKEGRARAQFEVRIVHETPSTGVIDGGAGLGPPVAYQAMQLAISKAKDSYVGFVSVRNSNHFGIAGYYAMMALEHDMIGISTSNAKPVVLPTFGCEAMLGTNPLSIAVPAGRERPFVLDMATSTVAQGKVEICEREGKPIPLGWATDEKGRPTNDPTLVLRNIGDRIGGGLLPLGGMGEELGGHKGYGLALVVDVFAALLSGAAFSDLTYPADKDGRPLPSNIGHFLGAIRVDGFRPLSEFKATMDDLIRRIKSSSKLEGIDRIYIHGEKEFETSERRQREGIPLCHEVALDLQTIAKDLGLRVPF